jgi:hypothetical protein
LWRNRQLIGCGKASSQSSMGCELRKHVVPLLKDIPLELPRLIAAGANLDNKLIRSGKGGHP